MGWKRDEMCVLLENSLEIQNLGPVWNEVFRKEFQRIVSWDFLGTHSRVADRTRLFPVREDSGKFFGSWTDLALGGTHKNTRFRVVRAAGA